MPPVSQAQRRWAYATVAGKTDTAPYVGEKFLGHGVKGLPERVGKVKHAMKRLAAKRASS